ncbi:hypothetical protein Hypma_014988 [Hypsizygus marmoreus]|uniref:Uncharacterized protein n=1 Tax=Hypsizygus marmoreus TaxID=39966 RepID=A0A369K405_HYPMA|nr:hypothetical protein Hypma_014988 [Hypsizygus marmoreus]
MAGATRQMVSYDDITLPYTAETTSQPHTHSPKPPPAKKRKWANKPKGRYRESAHYTNGTSYTNNGASHFTNGAGPSSMQVDEDDNVEDGDESRELTHDEIWDDSALIDAWNAATEEYEAYNGPDKGWKNGPAHKSPLWYNIPPAPSKNKGKSAASAPSGPLPAPTIFETSGEADSRPLNFDTFVPLHDPSLDLPVPPPQPYAPELGNNAHYLSNTSGQMRCTIANETFRNLSPWKIWIQVRTKMLKMKRRMRRTKRLYQPNDDLAFLHCFNYLVAHVIKTQV